MAETHGVLVYESPTSIIAPITADSAVQVVIGTAPINMGELANPFTPKLCYTYNEAVSKIGVSRNYAKFTLMQSIVASFEIYNIRPVVYINVIDPTKHIKTVTAEICNVINGAAMLNQEGVLLDTVVLKGDTNAILVNGVDYSIKFDKQGYTVIQALSGGKLTASVPLITAEYTCIDPSKVTKADIIEGIGKIREVYPRFNIVPGQLLAPGYSHEIEVYNALTANTVNLNGQFSCVALADVDCNEVKKYDEVNAWKNKNSFTDKNSIVFYPKCRIGDDIFCYSAIAGAHIARVDAENESVPYVSPSNHNCKISGICDSAGNELIFDMQQANLLNSQGIVTAINQNGWRMWGNRTAGYPGTTDVKDSFISVRRMFCWWGNTFILTYFQKVDTPMNRRLIESIVDSENIRAGGFKARGQIADAYIEYNAEDNPVTDLLNGTIRFKQHLTPFAPAQTIINVLEFDPDALVKSLKGE